jgi:TatD DNase family protein
MALIDFHCHLDLYADPVAVAHRAVREGIYILSVTTTPSAFAGTSALAPSGGRIRTALGLHPELAAARENELPLFKKLLHQTSYVGEVGLDGSPAHRQTLDIQARVMAEILNACAAAGGKTISLHSRGAAEFLLDLIEFEPAAGEFVLHWFSAKPAVVERAAQLGCWFSIGSSMIASKTGRAAVEAMPADRILPESDGPFAVLEGRPVHPWDIGAVYAALAEAQKSLPEQIERRLTENFRNLVKATPSLNSGP